MTADDLLRISRYVMPPVPAQPSALGFLFGTRHGVEEFCQETCTLWQAGMFGKLLVSGGATASNPSPRPSSSPSAWPRWACGNRS